MIIFNLQLFGHGAKSGFDSIDSPAIVSSFVFNPTPVIDTDVHSEGVDRMKSYFYHMNDMKTKDEILRDKTSFSFDRRLNDDELIRWYNSTSPKYPVAGSTITDNQRSYILKEYLLQNLSSVYNRNMLYNPDLELSYAFQNNCQRNTVTAYMRFLGYDVVALPKHSRDIMARDKNYYKHFFNDHDRRNLNPGYFSTSNEIKDFIFNNVKNNGDFFGFSYVWKDVNSDLDGGHVVDIFKYHDRVWYWDLQSNDLYNLNDDSHFKKALNTDYFEFGNVSLMKYDSNNLNLDYINEFMMNRSDAQLWKEH